MVEKVFISPNRVRAYGNIVNMKTVDDFELVDSVVTESTDTVYGSTSKVFSMEVASYISLTATNPYLVSGETTDLVVSLVNAFGSPLSGKTVTVTGSDGSSYNGITNTNGLFTLSDVEVTDTITMFTATYSNVSATCKVILATKRDYGTSSNHNDIWSTNTTSSTIKVTRTDSYTEFAELTSANLINTVSGLSEDSIIEFDYYQSDGLNTNSFMNINDSNSVTIYTGGINLNQFNALVGEWYHFKISFNNGTMTMINETTNTTITKSYTSTPAKFNFWASSTITAIRFKNFVIY